MAGPRLAKILIGLAAAALAAGCTETTEITPTVSGVFPNQAFVGRTLDVTIAATGTEFTSMMAPTVSFGQDVMVANLSIASPTALVVTVNIPNTSAPGKKDITVTAGGETMTYAGGFLVTPPAELKLDGTQAQGSILLAEARNRDFQTPFDDTCTAAGFFGCDAYGNIAVNAPGAGVFGLAPTAFKLSWFMVTDLTAEAGAQDLDILSGPMEMGDPEPTHFPVQDAYTLMARSPTALGTVPSTGMVSAPYESSLFSYTPGGTSIITTTIASTDPKATPGLALIAPTGRGEDFLVYSDSLNFIGAGTMPFYLISFDGNGGMGYPFSITSTKVDVPGGPETEPNNTSMAANAVMGGTASAPYVVTTADLSSLTDEDWFTFTAAMTDIGKCVHVTTGDLYTGAPNLAVDTLVEVFEGATTLGGPSDDAGFHEDWISAKITAAGAINVKISASMYPNSFDPTINEYVAFVYLDSSTDCL